LWQCPHAVSGAPNRRKSLPRSLPNFNQLRPSLVWQPHCVHKCRAKSAPDGFETSAVNECPFKGVAMSAMLVFLQKWNGWYRVLRHNNAFNLVDSVCYGIWLARG
jgi:hypothetical protein